MSDEEKTVKWAEVRTGASAKIGFGDAFCAVPEDMEYDAVASATHCGRDYFTDFDLKNPDAQRSFEDNVDNLYIEFTGEKWLVGRHGYPLHFLDSNKYDEEKRRRYSTGKSFELDHFMGFISEGAALPESLPVISRQNMSDKFEETVIPSWQKKSDEMSGVVKTTYEEIPENIDIKPLSELVSEETLQKMKNAAEKKEPFLLVIDKNLDKEIFSLDEENKDLHGTFQWRMGIERKEQKKTQNNENTPKKSTKKAMIGSAVALLATGTAAYMASDTKPVDTQPPEEGEEKPKQQNWFKPAIKWMAIAGAIVSAIELGFSIAGKPSPIVGPATAALFNQRKNSQNRSNNNLGNP